MRAWPVCLAAALAAVVALLGFDAGSTPADPAPRSAGSPTGGAPPAARCSPRRRTGRFHLKVRSGGKVRTALVNVPPSASGREALPVMVALHGAGGWGEFMEEGTGLTPEANRAGFIAVYPNANGKFWRLNGRGEQANDDVEFIRALLDRLGRAVCADPTRAYVTGASNGAGLVARIGCELSDRVAAIAPVSGGYYRLPPCRPDRPVSVLEVHGTADPTVPYGGKYGEGSVPVFIAQWRQFDGCGPAMTRRRLAAHVLRTDWTSCASGTSVAHIKILGGHHAWQGTPIGGGDDYIHLSTQRQVVQFFRGKRLAQPQH